MEYNHYITEILILKQLHVLIHALHLIVQILIEMFVVLAVILRLAIHPNFIPEVLMNNNYLQHLKSKQTG